MFEVKALSHAVSEVVAGMRQSQPPSYEDVSRLAGLARATNEHAVEFLTALPPFSTERPFIALQLMRLSFDHARALLLLLEQNPVDLAAPALALHRSQIETFVRSVYLGFIASDEQVEYFLAQDRDVWAKNERGKWQPISVPAMAEHVGALIDRTSEAPENERSKLPGMVRNAWSPLCGFVHGGRAIHELYLDSSGAIGSNFSPQTLLNCVSNCYAVTSLAFSVLIAHVHALPGIPYESPLGVSMQTFMQALEAARSRREAGTPTIPASTPSIRSSPRKSSRSELS